MGGEQCGQQHQSSAGLYDTLPVFVLSFISPSSCFYSVAAFDMTLRDLTCVFCSLFQEKESITKCIADLKALAKNTQAAKA